MTRPARKKIPMHVKLAACERELRKIWGCDALEYDHVPGLWQREVNAAGTDYIPPQNDPDSIFVKAKAVHRRKTHGAPATSYGSDSHARAKDKRIRGETKQGPVKKIPAHANPWPPAGSRKLASRPLSRKEARR